MMARQPAHRGEHLCYLSIFDEDIVFSSDRPGLLEKCIRLQYDAIMCDLPEGYSRERAWRVHIHRPESPAPVSVSDDSEEVKLDGDNGNARLYYDEGSRAGIAVFDGGNEQDDARMFFSAITTFVQLVLRKKGYCVFHASAVSWRGRGILIAGHNGSGKSTLMRLLLEAGAEYLADDAAVVDTRVLPCLVKRSPEMLNVAELSRKTRDMILEKGFSDSGGEVFMAPPRSPLEVPINIVLFPSIVKGELFVVSLTSREAFLKLLELIRTPLTRNDYEKAFEKCAEIAEASKAASVKISFGNRLESRDVEAICDSL